MRVISGRFKGRQLVNFKANHIRPTTDRVKESVFNILGGEIESARVLDLFSGTGNLAIEALSRGAKYVEAVENHKRSLDIIRENLCKLNVDNEVRVVSQDVFRYLKSYRGDGFDLIFIDPPFTEKWAHRALEVVQSSKVIIKHTLIMIESSRHERVDDAYGPLTLLDRRQFGDKTASFFRVTNFS